ncbi:MAG: pitrilysin family protein [candidate division Zixibacteria bacterium]
MVKFKFSALIICLMLFSVSVFAGDTPELKFEKYTLPNGLDVILHEDHAIPMVSVNIWYNVASKNEKPGRTGFAHLFEHLMFQGSPQFDDEYFEPLQSIGGAVNGSTSNDRTNYWENVPSNYLELALAMESDRMGYLLDALTQERMDTQKDVVKNERRQGVDNQPYGRANEIKLSMLYPPDHPYSWTVIGSLDDLTAATLENAKEFFRMYYAPNNASLCIAGDFSQDKARALVEKYFAPIPPGPPIERLQIYTPILNGEKRTVYEDNVQLPRLYYAWFSPPYYAPGDGEMDIIASALSSGRTSRLYKSLVYEKQIAQDIVAFQASRTLGSSFEIIATARAGHTLEELEQAINEELRIFLEQGITADELKKAQITFEAGFIRRLENVGGFRGRANTLNSYNTFLGSPDMLKYDMDRYANATIEGVNEVARKYIDLNNRVVLHIVPQGELKASETLPERSAHPGPDGDVSFTPPEIQKGTLSNGIEIYLVEDNRLPLIQMSVSIIRGRNLDPTDKFGLANLTADLLDEGTSSRTSLQISDEINMLAANLRTSSGQTNTTISLNVLKKNLNPALDLMADIILNPSFPEEELERKKKNYLGRIRQSKSRPTTVANNTFAKLIYGESHPFGQPTSGTGTKETLENITRDDIVNFCNDYYTADAATIVIAGDISLSEAQQKLNNVLKDWKKGDASISKLPTPNPIGETKIYIVDKPGAAQSAIVMGNTVELDDFELLTPINILNRPLGGQFTSRINLNLREDKGYTYGASSRFQINRETGIFVASTQVHSQYTKESVFEMVKEITDINESRPLSNDELANSKQGSIKSYPQGFESLRGITRRLQNLITFGRPLDSWKTYNQRVEDITLDDAKTLAKKYIHPDKLIIVVVGDREKIEEGLKELNLGEVIAL